jgi:hypothetical protein
VGNVYETFVRNKKERDYVGGTDGRIILKRITKEYDMRLGIQAFSILV